MRRVYRRKRPFEYLLPFLIFVGIGVIVVLGFQLWNNLQGVKGDVYFYVASGKAKMLQYGLTEWDNAYSGTKLLLGDSVKTSQDSRGVLQFFNGTIVRLGDDTEVTITDITKRSDVEKIGLTLTHGSVWIDKKQTEGVDQSDFQVRTSHMLVSDVGTVFEVESDTDETVRVMKGNVKAQILGNPTDVTSILDSVQVGVGQEMTLNAAILKSFQNHETPSVLMALSDDFKLSDWYLWNSREDESPSDFSISSGIETSGSSEAMTSIEPTSLDTEQSATPSTEQIVTPAPTGSTSTTLQPPVISQPSPAVVTTDKNKMTISGTVGAGTAKIVISETIGGNTDEYTLGKFKSGDTSFSYNVSDALGNYKSGENIYRVFAVDADGKRSDSSDVHITYSKPEVTITDALSAPQVSTYNGSPSSTVTVGVVKVEGTVAGAKSVVVNGYTLSQFQPGDKTWVYYANESAGNLTPGENSYQVYAVDPQGNKSDTTTFAITYNKTASAQTQASSGSTTSSSTTTSTTQTTGGSSTEAVPEGF